MKWFILPLLLLLAIMVGVLMVHDQGPNAKGSAHMRVAVIMTGMRNDRSWNEAHYEALEKVAKRLNLEMAYYENVPSDSTAYIIMEKAVSNGAKVVIPTSIEYGDAALAAAKEHPDVKFLHATGIKTESNVSTFFGRVYQMRYLTGIVAGLKTKTNEIGYVAAYNISEVNRGINAFALGVQKVNPNAKVFVSWSNSWVDESMAADATRDLLSKHRIDVLTVHVNALSPYEIADEKNIWIIGYNKDNSLRFPKHFLTASVWHWERFYGPQIELLLRGKYVSRSYWLGAETGVVDLAPMTEHVDEDTRRMVEQERDRLANTLFDVFQGPIVDNHGCVRVEKGESMTDEDLLNNFNWYVKGVVDGFKP